MFFYGGIFISLKIKIGFPKSSLPFVNSWIVSLISRSVICLSRICENFCFAYLMKHCPKDISRTIMNKVLYKHLHNRIIRPLALLIIGNFQIWTFENIVNKIYMCERFSERGNKMRNVKREERYRKYKDSQLSHWSVATLL